MPVLGDEALRADPYTVTRLRAPFDATARLPGSKSITNRALVCAALATGSSVLEGALIADDTVAMTEALWRLGVPIAHDAVRRTLTVGNQRPLPTPQRLDARQSGTTARFLLPLLALYPGPFILDGDAQLRGRPMGPTLDALRSLGARVASRDGGLPVQISGPIGGGRVELPGDISSQFLSGLLLAGPHAVHPLTITLTTELVSRTYVDMTVAVIEAFGGVVECIDDRTWVVPPRRLVGRAYVVEPDASTASYAFAAAAMTGSRVTVPGLHRGSLQGDVAFVDILEAMGAVVEWHDDAITVQGTGTLRGVDVDLEPISDTVPTLAAVAAVAEGTTRIRGVGFIRRKESDRIAGPVHELRKLGIDATEHDDGMSIVGGAPQPGIVDTYRDHRMAMAFGLLGLVVDGIEIADPGCVAKTFGEYWNLLDALRRGTLPPARRP